MSASHPVEVLEIGSSDWIVHATEGCYSAEEAFFLGQGCLRYPAVEE